MVKTPLLIKKSQIVQFLYHFSDNYWPVDTVPVYYGDIKVTLLNDSHYPDWVVTEFMLQRVSWNKQLISLQTFST